MMLKDTAVGATIPSRDMEKARRFYEDALGLQVKEEDAGGITYRSGHSLLYLYETESAGTAQHTLAAWEVDDIEATADELIGRGVTFEQYDFPDLKTDAKGIADIPAKRMAWFKDPDGNILGVFQPTV